MLHFNRRAIASAISAAFRPKAPARAARRKPLFEALEPRVMLSAEIPVVPPPAWQGEQVLSAPLEFGNDTGSLALQLQAPRVLRLQDGWGNIDTTGDSSNTPLTLDFSAVQAALQFDILADGRVRVTDGTNHALASNVVELVGGAGDDHFVFQALAGVAMVIQTGGQGADQLDFSAVLDDLSYVTHTDGSVTVSAAGGAGSVSIDRALATVPGQGRNTFVEEKAPWIAGTLHAGVFSAQAAQLSLAAFVATQPTPRQIVIVDSGIQNYQSLLRDLPALPAAPASVSPATLGQPSVIAGSDKALQDRKSVV